MKVLAVGDIHTKRWIIEKVLNIAGNYDKVVLVGDYADDWNASAVDTIETWRDVKMLTERCDNVVALMGNHDYEYTLNSGNYIDSIVYVLTNVPENKGLKSWLPRLPIFEEIDGVLYSHAGLTQSWGDGFRTDLLRYDSPIWARPRKCAYKDMRQVFGHTPCKTCYEVETGVWCIDTFSTKRDGTPIGDQTVLEIIDGKKFNVIKL